MSVRQEPPYTDIFRRGATTVAFISSQSWMRAWARNVCRLRMKTTELLAKSSIQSQFCMSFRNQGPKVWWLERHRIQRVKFRVNFPQSVMICDACHLPVQRQCSYQEILEHFILQAVWRCTLTFSAGLSSCPVCQTYFHMVSWPCYYYACLASYVTWPASHR